MPEIGTSGSMSGDGKRGDARWHKLPRPSSTLPIGQSNLTFSLSKQSKRSISISLTNLHIVIRVRGNEDDMRRAVGGDRLLQPRRPALPLAERRERVAEIVLRRRPLQ